MQLESGADSSKLSDRPIDPSRCRRIGRQSDDDADRQADRGTVPVCAWLVHRRLLCLPRYIQSASSTGTDVMCY
jgi:hypothetical protein